MLIQGLDTSVRVDCFYFCEVCLIEVHATEFIAYVFQNFGIEVCVAWNG